MRRRSGRGGASSGTAVAGASWVSSSPVTVSSLCQRQAGRLLAVASDEGPVAAAAIAGHRGDEAAARALLDHDQGAVRAAALAALARMGALADTDLRAGL